MALKTKTEGNFTYIWSDAGYLIHGGDPEDDYALAKDPVTHPRTYTETSTPIPTDDHEPTETDYAIAGRILLGEGETA